MKFFIYQLFVFLIAAMFYSFAAFLLGGFLFSKFVRSLDESKQFTPRENRLLVLMVAAVLIFGFLMGAWLASDIRISDNPWQSNADQTQP
jgi:hypothetical protein